MRAFREQLETRNERDLGPVASDDLPSELEPLAVTLNALFERLRAAFEAERSLSTNTAHELRTPSPARSRRPSASAKKPRNPKPPSAEQTSRRRSSG
ncbi:hypothetical protein ACVDG8_036850 [Mesorhizobium sp. ORM8.1]